MFSQIFSIALCLFIATFACTGCGGGSGSTRQKKSSKGLFGMNHNSKSSAFDSNASKTLETDEVDSGAFKTLDTDDMPEVDGSGGVTHLRPVGGTNVKTITSDFDKIPELNRLMKMIGVSMDNFNSKESVKQLDGFEFSGVPFPVLYTNTGSSGSKIPKKFWTVELNAEENIFKISANFHFTHEKTSIFDFTNKKRSIFLTGIFGVPDLDNVVWNHGVSIDVLKGNEKLQKAYDAYKSDCHNDKEIVFKFLNDIWDNGSFFFQTSKHSEETIHAKNYRAYAILISDGPLKVVDN